MPATLGFFGVLAALLGRAPAIVAFAALTGEHRYRDAAESGLASAAEVARQAPRFAGWTLAAAEAMLAGPASFVLDTPFFKPSVLVFALIGWSAVAAVIAATAFRTAARRLQVDGG